MSYKATVRSEANVRTMSDEPRAGRLSKAFVATAFVNFLVGATLGGWMVSNESLWGYVSPLHGEINPFGFLTLLIYGMTYAVLQMLAGLTPPKAWIGALHFCIAEMGVIVIVIALLGVRWLLLPGLMLQALAPIVFLINILSAVRAKRASAKHDSLAARPGEHGGTSEGQTTSPLLSRDPSLRPTDRVAQRGTDVSLMLLIVGSIWILVLCAQYGESIMQAWDGPHLTGFFLVAYGWIVGTILSVSLHLFPRFFGVEKFSARSASLGQVLWGSGVVIALAGVVLHTGAISRVGDGLLGLSILWFATMFLRSIWASSKASQRVHAGYAAMVAWSAAWLFFMALGVSLVIGLPPTSIPALHMLFLGFSTSLVYGVGYGLFPRLFGRRDPNVVVAVTQVMLAVLGALLMVIAFIAQLYGIMPGWSTNILTVGGICAATAAVIFIFTWLATGRRYTVDTHS